MPLGRGLDLGPGTTPSVNVLAWSELGDLSRAPLHPLWKPAFLYACARAPRTLLLTFYFQFEAQVIYNVVLSFKCTTGDSVIYN